MDGGHCCKLGVVGGVGDVVVVAVVDIVVQVWLSRHPVLVCLQNLNSYIHTIILINALLGLKDRIYLNFGTS